MPMQAAPPLADAAAPGCAPRYRVRLAAGASDLHDAQALRFEVFNLELDEGLARSYEDGLDVDPFDAVCDHLVVHEEISGALVGTYRLQTGARAAAALGYYSEREFDFSPFEPLRAQTLELGRACIHRDHRSFAVLNLLWRGIAAYALEHGTRFLVGCSSLTSLDAGVGAAAFRALSPRLAPPDWRTTPKPDFACPMDREAVPGPRIPRLLSAYLALGACICGPPAIDREFRTIDFLTWLDLESPALKAMQRRGRFVA